MSYEDITVILITVLKAKPTKRISRLDGKKRGCRIGVRHPHFDSITE